MRNVRRGATALIAAPAALAGEPSAFTVPIWLYPSPPPAIAAQVRAGVSAAPANAVGEPLSVPGSDRRFTLPQLRNYFAAPDWHPQSHAPAPDVVMHGRRPDLLACGFCHLPDGAGRPENAPLAGLSAHYIVEQMTAFASGARGSAWTATPYLPTEMMVKVAAAAPPSEAAVAAAYFASLRLHEPRAQVVETERVPRIDSAGWVHTIAPEGGEEALGMRLIEVPRDSVRHERRDSRTEYVAYVPPGSVARGLRLATSGTLDTVGALGSAGTPGMPGCVTCHGSDLRGVGDVPPLAGRSPTYLLRQLVAFRTGARSAPAAAPMVSAVAALSIDEMIAAAAYAASLQP